MNKRTIAAAALAAGLIVQTQGFAAQGFAQVATATRASTATVAVDPEAAARKNWRKLIANNPVSAEGCSHVSYPNFSWESVECKVVPPRVQPVRVNSPGEAPGSVGNGNDYIAQAQGLISYAAGEFQITGVTSETGVSVNGGGGILGPNEYMVQINTNNDRTTSACAGHSGCTVWQQFMYATDYDGNNTQSAVFIQYWLFKWNAVCPSGWWPSDNASHEDCYRNSSHVEVPHLPVTELGNIAFTASATPGGNDVLMLVDGSDAYVVTANDNVLDIGSVWYQAEFNVVGDTNRAQADFNNGSSINVILQLADGSNSAPSCVRGIATTGETNNLSLGACQAFVFLGPAIEFTESLTSPYRIPPIVGVKGIAYSSN
jgi:hypothetical protein